MNRSIAIAYGIAGLSAAIATLAVFALVSGGPEVPPQPGPAAMAWTPPEAVALAADPVADPAYPQSVVPAEPPVQYVDEQGRPVDPPAPGAPRGEREDDDDDDDDHEEREHRRGHREHDDD